MSLLEQDIVKKGQVDQTLLKPENNLELEIRGNKKYKVKAIIDNAVYGQQANNNN